MASPPPATPTYSPVRMAQVLLFAEEKNYNELAGVVWAAMTEAQELYTTAGLIAECHRFVCMPGASPALSETLPAAEHAGFGSGAAPFWQEVRAKFSRTYDQKLIAPAVRSRYIAEAGLQSMESLRIFIVTDQEICPPPDWRYMLWEGVELDAVFSTAAMDPRYWSERMGDPRTAIKHRLRTGLANATGETIDVRRCENEQCLMFGGIDSVARLDAMLRFGPEHGISALTGLGFDAECGDPEQVQPVSTNPQPPKTWGVYAG